MTPKRPPVEGNQIAWHRKAPGWAERGEYMGTHFTYFLPSSLSLLLSPWLGCLASTVLDGGSVSLLERRSRSGVDLARSAIEAPAPLYCLRSLPMSRAQSPRGQLTDETGSGCSEATTVRLCALDRRSGGKGVIRAPQARLMRGRTTYRHAYESVCARMGTRVRTACCCCCLCSFGPFGLTVIVAGHLPL